MPDILVKVLAIIGGITVLLLLLALSFSFYLRMNRNRVPSGTVLEVDFRRGLREYVPESPLGRIISGEQLTIRTVVEALDIAARDKRVSGVIGRVGGAPIPFADAQEIRDAVIRFRASGKPAYAFAETLGELGPGNSVYYLSTAFDRIYLQPTGSVGLTGIMSQGSFLKGTLDKLDVVPQLGARKEYKNARNIFTEKSYTEAHKEVSQSIIESVLAQMVKDIADARNMTEKAFRELVVQGPYSAEMAFKAGLIDGLEYRDQVFEKMLEKSGPRTKFLYLSRYYSRLKKPVNKGKAVALIYGEGNTVQGRSRFNPLNGEVVMGSETIAAAFRAAIKDKDVGAIVFRINSPGGSAIGSDEIWRETVRARDAGKAVVVTMGAVAGSGGYFVAMNADRIVAHPSTITGSIGVVGGKFVTRGLYNKLGVTFDDVVTSSNATIWSPMHQYSEKQWEYIQLWLDKVYEDFVVKVAQGRGLKKERVMELAKGRIYTGNQALELNLVDTLGGFPAAFSSAKELMGLPEDQNVRIKVYPRRRTLLEQFFGRGAESSDDKGRIETELDFTGAMLPSDIIRQRLNLNRGALLMEDPELQ